MDAKTYGNQPAHPYSDSSETVQVKPQQHPGLTKREYIAVLSLSGIRASGETVDAAFAAKAAVTDADALLAELAKAVQS